MNTIGTRISFGCKGCWPRVLLSVPTTGKVHKIVAQKLLIISNEESINRRLCGDIVMPTNTPYENNLHTILQDFLNREYDYWISFDSDNPPIYNILDLIFFNKPLIGCPTPVWCNMKPGDWPMYWNAYKKVEGGYTEWPIKSGLQEVDAIGTGCFIARKDIFVNLKAPFQRIYDENGMVHYGNDLAFCQRIKKAGFKIYCHYNYPCYHFSEIEIGEVSKAFQSVK